MPSFAPTCHRLVSALFRVHRIAPLAGLPLRLGAVCSLGEAIAADASAAMAGIAGAVPSEAASLAERDSTGAVLDWSRPRNANVSALTVISDARNGFAM